MVNTQMNVVDESINYKGSRANIYQQMQTKQVQESFKQLKNNKFGPQGDEVKFAYAGGAPTPTDRFMKEASFAVNGAAEKASLG